MSAVVAGAVAAELSWPALGAQLDDLPDEWQGALGVLCGAVVASPALLLLDARLRRRALGATLCWLLAAAVCLLWPLPFRGDRASAAEFRGEAGWYVPAALLAFFLLAVVVLRRLPADAAVPLRDRLVRGRRPVSRG
jgi:hypothetical protein